MRILNKIDLLTALDRKISLAMKSSNIWSLKNNKAKLQTMNQHARKRKIDKNSQLTKLQYTTSYKSAR